MFLNLPGFALRNIRQAAPTRQLYSFIHRGAAP
jgi:hypothetical protein